MGTGGTKKTFIDFRNQPGLEAGRKLKPLLVKACQGRVWGGRRNRWEGLAKHQMKTMNIQAGTGKEKHLWLS